jgi:glutamate 5-kinase
LDTLLENSIIPIINENDTIATNELRYGDNDRLGARVAQMVDANLLVLLSDVDGLYTKDPSIYEDAQHIPVVQTITDDIQAMGGASNSGVGSGGMFTKIEAAKIANLAGCHTLIAKGIALHPIKKL